ncbi:MAG: RNA polymerase subunit sigma-24, partial [Actinomycetota bacterium]|nr:RNA polymerase subunit sigma-24 [Actinomycetota bacterium]
MRRVDGERDDVLGVLARERGGALLGYAMLVCGQRAAAEDLVQDALVKVFSRVRQGFTPDDAERYVRRAILTIHLDAYRKAERWRAVRHLFGKQDVADDGAPLVDDATDVHAALATLGPRHRACVVLRYFDDLTVP